LHKSLGGLLGENIDGGQGFNSLRREIDIYQRVARVIAISIPSRCIRDAAMTVSTKSDGPLRILFVSSEIYPLAKTGGLADVAAALPAALNKQGFDVRVMLPGYPQALERVENRKTVGRLDIGSVSGRIIEAQMPDSGLPVYLYDAPSLYARSGSLYHDNSGREWEDNHIRFGSLCRAAAAIALNQLPLRWRPDVVHANDWHTGLLPALLRGHTNAPRSVFTIHNLAFQGNFPWSAADDIGLPSALRDSTGIEFYGQLSFLKAGLHFSDQLTTVSPNYAREILTSKYGCGFEGLLRSRSGDLTGILNGVDYGLWDPACDASLPMRYRADDLEGKRACKAAVQSDLGLEPSERPLAIYVNRLTEQKMADVVLTALPELLADGIQVVVHGQGDRHLESALSNAARGREDQLAVKIGYEEPLARRLNAAADISLTPSRFEPCGLTTMYAMRYGALPVTRAVGGLADTVVDPESAEAQKIGATGFLFEGESPQAMRGAVRRAMHSFQSRDWLRYQETAMRRNFAWERSAQSYGDVYRRAIEQRAHLVSPAAA
jgi:starch synthase